MKSVTFININVKACFVYNNKHKEKNRPRKNGSGKKEIKNENVFFKER